MDFGWIGCYWGIPFVRDARGFFRNDPCVELVSFDFVRLWLSLIAQTLTVEPKLSVLLDFSEFSEGTGVIFFSCLVSPLSTDPVDSLATSFPLPLKTSINLHSYTPARGSINRFCSWVTHIIMYDIAVMLQ